MVFFDAFRTPLIIQIDRKLVANALVRRKQSGNSQDPSMIGIVPLDSPNLTQTRACSIIPLIGGLIPFELSVDEEWCDKLE